VSGAPATGLEHELTVAVAATRGHFRYESGHHGDLWLELDGLLADAPRLRRWAAALARQAQAMRPHIVCGPLTGGAFLAQLVAVELRAGFAFAERLAAAVGGPRYRIPAALRPTLREARVLLVDDAVNAASALRATLAELEACGARPVGLACLLSLGDGAAQLARERAVPLVALASLGRRMWRAEDCALCRAGMALADPLAAA
jgi:orotate phosphoribosyltransferase